MPIPTLQTHRIQNCLFRAAALLGLLCAGGVQAAEVCGTPDGTGAVACKAGLSTAQIESIRVAQEKSQWCWAASISMVFAHHGYSVPQEGIVRQHFGEGVDQPVAGSVITSLLEARWTDRKGRPFSADATVAEAPDTRPGPAHRTMVDELTRQHPLLIGVGGHAMVLVRVEYDRLPATGAIRITGGTVIDPRPGRGLRRLLPQERRPSYVAAVRVTDSRTLALAPAADTRL